MACKACRYDGRAALGAGCPVLGDMPAVVPAPPAAAAEPSVDVRPTEAKREREKERRTLTVIGVVGRGGSR